MQLIVATISVELGFGAVLGSNVMEITLNAFVHMTRAFSLLRDWLASLFPALQERCHEDEHFCDCAMVQGGKDVRLGF